MRLTNRIVVVTGAARNVGAALVKAFLTEGAKVAAVDISAEALGKLRPQLPRDAEDRMLGARCDVADSASVAAVVGQVIETWGRVDVLVNNASITDRGATVLDLDPDTWDRVLRISLTSVFLRSKHVGNAMAVRDDGPDGVIINMASTSGYQGRPTATVDGAAKAGVLNLTRSMAIQLAPYRIRVNSVTPNKIGSPVGEAQEPPNRERANRRHRSGEPRDVANAVVFLVSDAADFLTGADLLVDGGALALGGAVTMPKDPART